VKIAVITVSDRAAAGIYADRSGPAVLEVLASRCPGIETSLALVSDGTESVRGALAVAWTEGADWIITTGGTGPAPRDQTPEAVMSFCDRAIPGIAEYLRAESLKQTPNAVFSRGVAGMRGQCYVVTLPGSERAARFCAELLAPLLEHGRAMARGEGH
jgi:molybdenum cofactor synthesis domain-containing protein